MNCHKCRDLGYVVDPGVETATATVCSCRTPCPRCDDSGLVIDDTVSPPVSRPCECRYLRQRVARFNAGELPARFHAATLDKFEEKGGTQPEIRMHLMRYRTVFSPGARGLLLWGAPGTGKTHLICGLLRHFALEKGHTVRFVDFFHLLDLLRANWDGNKTGEDILESLVGVEVLAIDELGKRPMKPWELAILDQLISRRYNAGRTLLATTNLNAQEGEADLHERRLADEVQERIQSRLIEMCDFMNVTGPDYRRGKVGAAPSPAAPMRVGRRTRPDGVKTPQEP